jgi:hypothetical protein
MERRRCFLNVYPIDSQKNPSHQWTDLRNIKTIKNVPTFHTCYRLMYLLLLYLKYFMQLFARLALSHQAHLYFCYYLAINYSLKVLILT